MSSISYFRSAIRSRPTPNANPVYSSGSIPHMLQYVRMNHTTAKDFDPSGTFTETAAFTATLEAGYIHLCTWLCEREMMWSELYVFVSGPNSSWANSFQSSLKICKSDVLVNNQTFDLMEGRRNVLHLLHLNGIHVQVRSYGSAACLFP